MASLRHHIANLFGSHSRRVWRCVIGATWSLPLRYVTLALQIAAMGAVAGAVVHIPAADWMQVMSAGVLVGWVMRLADNLINEYLVFEGVKRFFNQPINRDFKIFQRCKK
jgi:hypothetical protein